MFNMTFANLLEQGFTFKCFMLCSAASIIIGLFIALLSRYKSSASTGFSMTLGILPFIVQVIIMLVNGNIGVGVAVAGAFSLVRFRSAQGTAKEILFVFFAMAVGLATGIGYVGIAVVLAVITMLFIFLCMLISKHDSLERSLRITIPEDLNYTEVFDDLLKEYTKSCTIMTVKTTNMGSLYKITYRVTLKDESKEKEFIDKLRCRNGNLEILCSRTTEIKTEL